MAFLSRQIKRAVMMANQEYNGVVLVYQKECAQKYFNHHLTEKIRSCILEPPIPGNEFFFNPLEIDDYIEDLLADHKSMKFL